jgi:hypothetical protein
MSNSLEAQGVIHSIGQTTEYGSNGFTKREFVIKLTGEHENADYPNYVAFELIKDKCALMDTYQPQMPIKVLFNLQGRLWQPDGKPEKCFNALQAWKIESLSAPKQQAPQQQGYQNPPNPTYQQAAPQQQTQQQPAQGMQPNDFNDNIPF